MVGPGDTIKVVNKSDELLQFTSGGRTATIKPHKQGLATFEQVVQHCGDPAAGTAPGKVYDQYNNIRTVPTREDELKRVMYKNRWDVSGHAGGIFETHPTPDIEFYDMEDNRIYFPSHDPEGSHAAPINAQTEQFQLEDTIKRMKAQIAMMEKNLPNGGADTLKVAGVDTRPREDDEPDSDIPLSDD